MGESRKWLRVFLPFFNNSHLSSIIRAKQKSRHQYTPAPNKENTAAKTKLRTIPPFFHFSPACVSLCVSAQACISSSAPASQKFQRWVRFLRLCVFYSCAHHHLILTTPT